MPPAVAAALYDELALDIAVRRTLAGAAVTGDPFVPELTAAAAELPEHAEIAALDDLLRRDLLRSTAVPRRFRFRHALVRRAVYQSALGGSPAPHPGGPSGAALAALTGRELQVARLIADRRTNAQIAAELFLSPKTVETHIRNVFTKLDVASRVEIARAVERADRDAR